MIYLFQGLDSVADIFIDSIIPLMPPERRHRALSYRFAADRNACVIAFWLLMQGLKREFGIEVPPRFVYGRNGKPYLADTPGAFFNISHCKAGVVCAISREEVGVDIQDMEPFDINLAKRVCTAKELSLLEQSDDPDRLFCRFWTIKEAYIKLHGKSIADGPDNIEAGTLNFFTTELEYMRCFLSCTDSGIIMGAVENSLISGKKQ